VACCVCERYARITVVLGQRFRQGNVCSKIRQPATGGHATTDRARSSQLRGEKDCTQLNSQLRYAVQISTVHRMYIHGLVWWLPSTQAETPEKAVYTCRGRKRTTASHPKRRVSSSPLGAFNNGQASCFLRVTESGLLNPTNIWSRYERFFSSRVLTHLLRVSTAPPAEAAAREGLPVSAAGVQHACVGGVNNEQIQGLVYLFLRYNK